MNETLGFVCRDWRCNTMHIIRHNVTHASATQRSQPIDMPKHLCKFTLKPSIGDASVVDNFLLKFVLLLFLVVSRKRPNEPRIKVMNFTETCVCHLAMGTSSSSTSSRCVCVLVVCWLQCTQKQLSLDALGPHTVDREEDEHRNAIV